MIAVLQRMLFGRSSERAGPAADGDDPGAGDGGSRAAKEEAWETRSRSKVGAAGLPGAAAVEVFWDFGEEGTAAQCGEPFTPLGTHLSGGRWTGGSSSAWSRTAAAVTRRVPVPGACDGDGARPAEGDGEGPVHQPVHRDAADRAVRGGPVRELAGDRAGPAGRGDLPGYAGRDGRAGGCAAGPAGGRDRGPEPGLLAPARGRDDLAGARPKADGPQKWWLWVFLGPEHRLLRHGPVRSGHVLARHAGIDENTGQLQPAADGGPRRLVLSTTSTRSTSLRGTRPRGWPACGVLRTSDGTSSGLATLTLRS